jgi:ATP-binding cassette subfamily F protein uup
MAVLLSGSALRRSFGARVLFENLSLSLSEGDRTGLIGPNGSGKTTLLEILAGKEAPDAGYRALRKQTKLAYVPQDSLFGPDDTVGSVLRAAVEGLPLDEEEKSVRVQVMLDRAGFDTSATPATALSGGWKKRLAIAAALVTSPDVLLLDEPTNHLDLEGILWLETAIQTVNTCLVVTHDRYFLENVANQMVEVNPVYPQSAFRVTTANSWSGERSFWRCRPSSKSRSQRRCGGRWSGSGEDRKPGRASRGRALTPPAGSSRNSRRPLHAAAWQPRKSTSPHPIEARNG